mmetsp:Transcript_25477/g.28496  ORF Transcript_25477/g.28496 Transcript_25477/m.28496 type:complete len:95 (+) Transcript_25477:393-677(+)
MTKGKCHTEDTHGTVDHPNISFQAIETETEDYPSKLSRVLELCCTQYSGGDDSTIVSDRSELRLRGRGKSGERTVLSCLVESKRETTIHCTRKR